LSVIASLVRAIAPVLAYPITRATLVTKKICALFGARGETAPTTELEPEQNFIGTSEFSKPDKPAEKFRPPVSAWNLFGFFRAAGSFLLEHLPLNMSFGTLLSSS
jgi:hypothetical protein